MLTLTCFILGFLLLRFCIALINLLSFPYLKKHINRQLPPISVLIPARNEEKNIDQLLKMLINQNYKNIEIIVCNDNSEDQTELILKHFVNTDKRISYFNAPPLPNGWLGKNYCCHLLAQKAKAPYYLFIDADIQIKNDVITHAISYLINNKLALLSIFPKQIMISPSEYATVPLMNEILLSLLPLFLIKDSHYPALAAANGQFMLFSAPIYQHYQYHSLVRNNTVEDICIIRLMKKQQLRVHTLLGTSDITCRMYTSLKDAINGFAKNIIQYFGGSIIVALLYLLITTFGWLAVVFYLPIQLFITFIGMALFLKIFISIASKQNVYKNLIFCLPRQIMLSIIIFKAIKAGWSKNLEWKGRKIN